MSYANPDALVPTTWLAQHYNSDDVVVLDATSHLPTAKRDAETEFAQKHIAGAQRFNIDDIAAPSVPLPHMLPDATLFAAKVGAMGISNDTRVVVYDVYGLQSAARAWWMFRVFGHDNVAVLSGGLPKWEAEQLPLSAAASTPVSKQFHATLKPELLRNVDDVLDNIDAKVEQVLDARAAGRFSGEQPEPRAGMRSGHIPNSLSLPFTNLLSCDREFLPAAELRNIIEGAGVNLAQPITASCGSGVTACVLALGCHLLGKSDVAIYDGSWSEWGGRSDTPIDTGKYTHEATTDLN